MKKASIVFVLICMAVVTLSMSGSAMAEDASGALANYNNPHDICDYFRSMAYTIERETDNECMASIGEGEFKVFTQVYYSGSEWCADVSNNGQVYQSECLPRKSSTDWNSIYFVAGFMILLFIAIGAINSIGKNKAPTKSPTIGTGLTVTQGLQEEQSPTNTRSVKTTAGSAVDEIEKLFKLKNKGIITQREFDIAKRKLLR